jgi:hypothetical protein
MTKAELVKFSETITQEKLKKAWTEKQSFTQDDSKVVKAAIPERIDRFYYAMPLLTEDAVKITKLEVSKFARTYELNNRSKLVIEDSFAEIFANAFYNEQNGARQIRELINRNVGKAIEEFFIKYPDSTANLKVTASLHETKKNQTYITISNGQDVLTIDGPKVSVKNRLLDPEFRERIKNLEANIKKEIFGQDEAVRLIAAAIKNNALMPDNKKPASGFLLGTTGTGKTELAKLVAKNMYGRPDAVGIFEMGKVMTAMDLGTILTPNKPYIGSNEIGQLERFLQAFPDGGVLLFDEMSNAGGASKAHKEEIAKAFYNMLDEGKYASPANGKVYDLSKYLILFTGNDGEKLFNKYASDSFLEEIYNELTSSPNGVNSLLLEAGFSPAFLGRLNFTHMMRPPLSELKKLIAGKMLGKWKKEVESAQPANIIYDEAFVFEIGQLLFSNSQGARSIDQWVSKYLGEQVNNKLMDLEIEQLIDKGQRADIKLSLKVTKATVPHYKGDEPDKNEAKLIIEASAPGITLPTEEADFTKAAFFMPQVPEVQAKEVAIHEMGHAVTAFTKDTGSKVKKITIVPENIGGNLSAAGYTQYRKVPALVKHNHDWLVKYIAGLLAGSEAEQLYGSELNVGRSNDVMRAGEIAKRVILDLHLVPGLDGAHAYADKDGDIVSNLPAEKRKIFDEYVEKVIHEARELAIAKLKEQWKLVEAGTELLMKQGSINEKEFEELQKKYSSENQDCSNLLAGT